LSSNLKHILGQLRVCTENKYLEEVVSKVTATSLLKCNIIYNCGFIFQQSTIIKFDILSNLCQQF